ncbi:MAG TPA: APC family permease [Bryobacteraceae bacterium]|nr:APC family permease [Bryobacteraceae bacterium]
MNSSNSLPSRSTTTTKVVVATTVMLSFISFWRAAAIVLSDMASSAYYVGGIAETAVGKSAPWFILAIMLFSYAVRSIYLESCSLFVRGGVYKVVHEAMGGTLAKFSVSALMFDYVLTGPISGVSAGLYLAGLINELSVYLHWGWQIPAEGSAAVFAIIVTIYFWRKNIIGIHESSEKALRIMQITTVMVVMLIGWCLLTIFMKGYQPVPLPRRVNIHFSNDALGWLRGTVAPDITFIAILIGLGHSLLAMSGFETLAQVYREVAHPKLPNLKKSAFVIILYSLLFTALVSFFAVMLIPDSERGKYLDNLIGGLSMFLVGPTPLKLLFHGFVVVVGVLILAGAVNTSIIGANGVLNRVAEDGVLPDWFRKPHRRFGTTNRLINTLALMQIGTIIISRGDVIMLGEAYAFGVVWSFAMKALSVLVLRFKNNDDRGYRVPFNIRMGKTEVPIGLGLITISLFMLACINVLTKQVATISGISFTLVFFTMFYLTERYNKRRRVGPHHELEQFMLDFSEDVSKESTRVRPGNVLVAVRNPNHLEHLQKTLEKTDARQVDIVVLSVHRVTQAASGEHDLEADQIFSNAETEVFSKAVTIAEKAGKHVELLAVAATDPWVGMVQTAQKLQSARIVTGLSPNMTPAEQGRAVGIAWENLPAPRPSLSLEVVMPDPNQSMYFNLGPHPPRLWPEDVDLTHKLWLDLIENGAGDELRHRDVVSVALRRLKRELETPDRDEILKDVVATVQAHGPDKVAIPERDELKTASHNHR